MEAPGQAEYNSVAMPRGKDHLAAARDRMLRQHLTGRGIADPAILTAFEQIPRERFIAADQFDQAYGDHPISIGYGQTISQPYIVAEMVQQLLLQPEHRILDVGAGSGYQAAILARLVEHVYAVERIEALRVRAETLLGELGITNVSFSTRDGSLGWASEAPFDGIIAGAAAPALPQAWRDQLVDGGRIVAPIGGAHSQELVVLTKRGDRWVRRLVCGVRFVHLIGEQGWADD